MNSARSWLLVLTGLLLSALWTLAEEPVDGPTEPAQPAAQSKDDAKAAEPQSQEIGPSSKRQSSQQATSDDDYYEFYRTLADTIDQVERNYVKPVDRRELMEAAIRGVISKLDPYSGFIDREEMQGFRTSVESQFSGIGIQITVDNGQLKVSSPLVGTPAYQAGVQAGDRILRIEGESTREMTLDQAVKKLKGDAGTSVTLSVEHSLTGRIETFTIKREQIHVQTVLGDHRQVDDSWDYLLDAEKRIGYIRITAFSRDTAGELRKALENLEQRKLRGLILDLRFNPGGLLTSAIETADLFIGEGRIVSTAGRNTEERVWDAVKPGTFEGFPMVVLVNHYSASASEIVSACLQDHHRAVVIGERTWGKGSVQNVIELESGKSALKLTTASYARPNGHNIHRFPDAKDSDEWGVKPNDGMEVRLSSEEMSRLLSDRRRRDIVEAKSAEPRKSTSGKLKADESANEKVGDVEKGTAKSGVSLPESSKKIDQQESEQFRERFLDRQLQKAIEYLSSELTRTK
ncbi:MAG: S41 family peptidase [Pirellulales bacterium]|nr:S41 family peptidase [Pirellulales bacterium]